MGPTHQLTSHQKPMETLRIDLPLFYNFAKIDRCFIERCSVWRGTQQNGAEGMTQLTWQNLLL